MKKKKRTSFCAAMMFTIFLMVIFCCQNVYGKTATSSVKDVGTTRGYDSGSMLISVYYIDPVTEKESLLGKQKITFTNKGESVVDRDEITGKKTTWGASISTVSGSSLFSLKDSTVSTYKNTGSDAYYKYLTTGLKLNVPAYYKYLKYGADVGGEFHIQKAGAPEGAGDYFLACNFHANGNVDDGSVSLTAITAKESAATYDIPLTVNIATAGLATYKNKRLIDSEACIFLTKPVTTATFKANGGEFEEGEEEAILNGISGDPLKAPVPTREGYQFKGYTPDASKFGIKDTVYTAKWEPNEFVVTFDANGAEGEVPQNILVNYNDGTIAPKNVSLKSYNKVFYGWSTDKNGDGDLYDPGDDISTSTKQHKKVVKYYGIFEDKDTVKLYNVPTKVDAYFGEPYTLKNIKVKVTSEGSMLSLQNLVGKKWKTVKTKKLSKSKQSYSLAIPKNIDSGDMRVIVTGGGKVKTLEKKFSFLRNYRKESYKITVSSNNRGLKNSVKKTAAGSSKIKNSFDMPYVYTNDSEDPNKIITISVKAKRGYPQKIDLFMGKKKVKSRKITKMKPGTEVTFTIDAPFSKETTKFKVKTTMKRKVLKDVKKQVKFQTVAKGKKLKLLRWYKSQVNVKMGSKAHKGYVKNYNNYDKISDSLWYDDDWCAVFVSVGALKHDLTKIMPVRQNCWWIIQDGKTNKEYQPNQKIGKNKDGYAFWPCTKTKGKGKNPFKGVKPGYLVLFDWQNQHSISGVDHVGVVYKVSDNKLITIEGNSGSPSSVRKNEYYTNQSIVGYFRPNYAPFELNKQGE